MILKDLADPALYPLKTTDTVEFATETLQHSGVAGLPVVREGTIEGFVALHQLMDLPPDHSILEAITSIPLCIRPQNQHYADAIRIFGLTGNACIALIDESEHFSGIVTPPGVLKFLSSLYSVQAEGSILCMEMFSRDYSLNELTRIIESNQAKIIGLTLETIPESTRVLVHLKLNTADTERVVSALQRFGYDITAQFFSNRSASDFENRYHSLLKYLEF